MGKIFTPENISSGFNTNSTLNTNFTNIETALDKCLSRDGESPNSMNADIDLNSNDLLNVGTANIDTLLVDGAQLPSLSDIQAEFASGQTTINASVTAAQTAETNAETAETNAETAATEAEHWANYPEDSLVPEGDGVDDYSALHWANKAAASAAGVNLPSVTTGDDEKMLKVNDTEDGYELFSQIATAQIADNAITTGKVNDTGITLAKLNSDIYASQAQAEAGTDSTRLMTPERVQQWYSATPSLDSATLGVIGFSGTTTLIVTYWTDGNTVYLFIPGFSSTSNSTVFSFSGLPAEIRPSAAIDPSGQIAVQDNGTYGMGSATIATNGDILIHRLDSSSGYTATFTSSGSKGIDDTLLTYPIDWL